MFIERLSYYIQQRLSTQVGRSAPVPNERLIGVVKSLVGLPCAFVAVAVAVARVR